MIARFLGTLACVFVVACPAMAASNEARELVVTAAIPGNQEEKIVLHDVQVGEELDKVGIGALVEDEKSGVDRMRHAVERDVDRVGVAAEVAVGFVERDIVNPAQLRGTRKSGNSCPDDRNLHPAPLSKT